MGQNQIKPLIKYTPPVNKNDVKVNRSLQYQSFTNRPKVTFNNQLHVSLNNEQIPQKTMNSHRVQPNITIENRPRVTFHKPALQTSFEVKNSTTFERMGREHLLERKTDDRRTSEGIKS